MNTEWVKTRQTKYAAYATTYIIIILAVLVVANFLANRYNKSFDATANKRYRLYDQTKKIARDLKQDVTIQYFDKPSGMPAGIFCSATARISFRFGQSGFSRMKAAVSSKFSLFPGAAR